MFKEVKTPLFVMVVLAGLFALQGLYIASSGLDEARQKEFSALDKKSKQILANISQIAQMSSLIYEFGLYDKNGNILFSTLKIPPKSLAFKRSQNSGYIYHKSALMADGELRFLVVAKRVDFTKTIIFAGLAFIGALGVILACIYFIMQSTSRLQERQNRLLRAFFNDAMHELKTPLGVAALNFELLDIHNRHTHRIKSALKQMKMTYEDVEFFIKNERVDYLQEIIDLSEFLQSRVRFFTTIASSKKILFELKVATEIAVFMSKSELMRLIDNNISNAIKYSYPNSKIIISLNSTATAALFSVRDFGVGIKDTKAIWRRYQREDSSSGGFGLGLNIVEQICRKYGIVFKLDSKLGEGSVFSYYIPLYKEKLIDRLTQQKPI